jgi:regulator of protease activity HflC (stomatin/prohibitin superfamily)
MEVNADVGISYHLNPEKISAIFQKYRKGIDEITDIYMRNYVRDAFNSIASKYPVEYVYGEGKSDLLKEVQECISQELTAQGIIVDKLYWIGSVRLPQAVITALNLKIEAKQRAEQRENELRETEAEAKKKIAEADGEAQSILLKAKAQAQANYQLSASLTSNLVQYEAIKKWDGKLPTYTGNNVPIINLK